MPPESERMDASVNTHASDTKTLSTSCGAVSMRSANPGVDADSENMTRKKAA